MAHPSAKRPARGRPSLGANAIKHALWFYPETVMMLDHIRNETGLSGSAVIRHLLAVYAAGTTVPPLPTIRPNAVATEYIHDLNTKGLGSR